MNKIILVCCFPCGTKYGNGKIKTKGAIGVWEGICDFCGKKTSCASAPHDFGYYSNKEIEADDKVQDLL